MIRRVCAFAVNLFTCKGRDGGHGVIVFGSVLSCVFYPDLLLILSYLQVIGQSAAGRIFTAVTFVMDVFISIYVLKPFCDFPRWKRNLSNRLQNLLAKTDSSDTFGITLFPLAVMDKLILLEPYPWPPFCGGAYHQGRVEMAVSCRVWERATAVFGLPECAVFISVDFSNTLARRYDASGCAAWIKQFRCD
ncbi:hypothetical protein LF934_06265 [Dickeya dadantii]|uniref:hypothetical protein n=1 Tax=Dickeya dadantii TaxID=204038 RepID=UPI001CF14593|nr:hypothetical protein [Dickeya dadantii]MCA7012247.1 hypothetical protein [Dickeya dadantii]